MNEKKKKKSEMCKIHSNISRIFGKKKKLKKSYYSRYSLWFKDGSTLPLIHSFLYMWGITLKKDSIRPSL